MKLPPVALDTGPLPIVDDYSGVLDIVSLSNLVELCNDLDRFHVISTDDERTIVVIVRDLPSRR